MHRFVNLSAVVLAGCFALAADSYAADKIVLSCLAIELNSDTGESNATSAKSIVIDADEGTVTTDIGVFAITQDMETVISFQDRAWKGEIDRHSWSGFIAPRSRSGKCKSGAYLQASVRASA
jgi:hypothetical protein